MGAAENKARVREYFALLEAGDRRLLELLADDVVWWVPPGSRMGGSLHGKSQVRTLLQRGLALYASDPPPRVEIERMVAEDDWVCVQLVIDARTAAGREYRNHYHFAFELRDGRIARVKEYVDTAYANERLLGG